ncbi:MAG TPA: hypothetical protein VLM89_10480 [Phycisphaerae bacterium]|nr:hypothetical protein [Phycisphaerae bacterium]
MSMLRLRLLSFLVASAVRSARENMDPTEAADRARKLSFETNAGKLGVRMTEHLRDRMRRMWLRLRSKP